MTPRLKAVSADGAYGAEKYSSLAHFNTLLQSVESDAPASDEVICDVSATWPCEA